jgi:hypothetical protein
MLDKLTHFHTIGRKNVHTGEITVLAFELGECETCGGPVQEPGAIWVSVDTARVLLLKPWDFPNAPAEIGHNDETGMTDCDDCPDR